MAMGTSTKGLFYAFPWQPFGNWKYLIFFSCAALAYNDHINNGVPWKRNIGSHFLIIATLRYLLFQLWGTATRLPVVSRKHQIVKKGITFQQIDHEANWEHTLILSIVLTMGLKLIYGEEVQEHLKPWDGKGLALVLLLHVGPVEWIYYWAHRALHHHYLYTRYHAHHHSSFVTQPITSTNHPMPESLFYNLLFSIPMSVPFLLGYGSWASIYIYILFIDFMDAWGHCNFEFIPKRLFDIIPPLKYIIYSPTFHALHHTKVHTNFSLFMPLYDYIYHTTDPTTDELHDQIRQGHVDKVDCVYLTHPTEVLSFVHLPFGFQTFAAQPFSKKWYTWASLPLSAPIMLLFWIFAKPFTLSTHFIGKSFELQTWIIPRFRFQYNIGFEKSRIQSWVENCILEAQGMGVKVIALGLLNKAQVSHEFLSDEIVNIPIVNGDTLTSAIIIKKIEALTINEIFLAQAETRVGQGIAKYLCEHGTKVLAMLPSREHFNKLHGKIDPNFQSNLMYATKYEDGKNSMVWVVGEEIGAKEQSWAPSKTWFHTFTAFPLPSCRPDCVYELVPSLELPDNAKTINVCEDILPRNVVRACYAAGMIHSQEGWKHNDLNEDISTYLIEKTWESVVKHGFTIPK